MSASPLRIAHVVNEPFNPESANGVQQVIWCLAQGQSALGQTVAVFSRDDGARYLLDSGEVAPLRAAVENRISNASLRERLLAGHLEPALAEEVLGWRPHVVHFHSVHIARNVALAARLVRAGTPYCVTVHGGLFRQALRRSRAKKTIFHLVFERRYLNEALFVHALSTQEAAALRACGITTRVTVIPNGPPPMVDKLPSRPEALFEAYPELRGRRIFMFVGRLDPWQKGLDLLIEALSEAAVRDVALVLVGPDWFGSRAALSELAARYGVSGQVIFAGQAFGDDRANLFAAADVFVHPSRWEGVSLSVLAAAASAKPCLITREADPSGELERAQAAFVVEANVASIAKGIKEAAALQSSELEAMGTRGRTATAARFDWKTITTRLVDEYRTGLTKHAPDSALELPRRDHPHQR